MKMPRRKQEIMSGVENKSTNKLMFYKNKNNNNKVPKPNQSSSTPNLEQEANTKEIRNH